VPPLTSAKIAVNFAHRIGAAVVVVAVSAMFARLRRFEPSHPLRQIIHFLLLAVATQILLGAYTVWSGKQPVITSLHVVAGALTLALSLTLALTARAVGWRTQAAGRLVAREVAA
jgi:cytochrome c oxidase assembly protein subunit 15